MQDREGCLVEQYKWYYAHQLEWAVVEVDYGRCGDCDESVNKEDQCWLRIDWLEHAKRQCKALAYSYTKSIAPAGGCQFWQIFLNLTVINQAGPSLPDMNPKQKKKSWINQSGKKQSCQKSLPSYFPTGVDWQACPAKLTLHFTQLVEYENTAWLSRPKTEWCQVFARTALDRYPRPRLVHACVSQVPVGCEKGGRLSYHCPSHQTALSFEIPTFEGAEHRLSHLRAGKRCWNQSPRDSLPNICSNFICSILQHTCGIR